MKVCNYVIRKCTSDDAKERGTVHYQSWQETYRGLMPDEFLDGLDQKELIQRAKDSPDNSFVAVVDNKIIGFCSYLSECRDFVSIKPSSEIVALYVLKSHQGFGIGKELVKSVINELSNKNLVLYVLDGNNQAINFYKHLGFSFTDISMEQQIPGGVIKELEMVLRIKNCYE